jgi:anaerobic magnesium-protoporphyrin IX monomethyl ester cyclase
MNNKILLVNLSLAKVSTTPFFVMPAGLLAVAAYLQKDNYIVEIIDFNVIKKTVPHCTDETLLTEFSDRLIKSRPSLVGFSIMVAGQFKLADDASKIVKKLYPDVPTVVGGAHVSQFPREILSNCGDIDFIVIGEGEKQASALAQFTRSGNLSENDSDGIAYRSNGRIVVKPKSSFMPNVNELPFPSYDLLNFNDYLHDTSTWHNPYNVDFGVRVPIITSRGCPNLCNFCSVAKSMGSCYRPMKAIKVADLIEWLYQDKSIRTFVIYDANFAQDTKRVVDICNEIRKRDLNINLDLPTGLPLNAATGELIDCLAGIGLIRTCVSVESGDLFIRNNVMKKQINENEAVEAIHAIRKYPQIFLMTDFVIGMPEETVKSLNASVEFIENLDTDDIDLSICAPYPGTALFDQCERDGLFFSNINKDLLYRLDDFSHSNRNKFIIKPYNLDHATLCEYRDRILELRKGKISAYHKRMKSLFNCDSNYRKNLVQI